MTARSTVVVTDDGQLTSWWPFVWERLEARLSPFADVRRIDPRSDFDTVDWATVDAIVLFSAEPPRDVFERAERLGAVAAVSDACGIGALDLLRERGIPFVDPTRAWAPSVAEVGLALCLCALRRIPYYHGEMAARREAFDYRYQQFVDDPRFVNGDLGTKRVGVVGLGQIGGRLATFARALGAEVVGYDPFVPASRFEELGITAAELDDLLETSEVVFPATPPTPTATGMIDARRVGLIRDGAIVVTVTRTAAIDVDAVRARVMDSTLLWATDVYDREPVALDDPILGRDNVVHVPHIAGRTRDTNLRVADLIADDLRAVADGQQPVCELTPQMVEIRTGTRR